MKVAKRAAQLLSFARLDLAVPLAKVDGRRDLMCSGSVRGDGLQPAPRTELFLLLAVTARQGCCRTLS